MRSIVYVFANFCHTFANVVAPPIDKAVNRLVRCKARLNRCWNLRPNWSIIGNAILPQNAAKLTKKHDSHRFYQQSELGVLRSMAPCDTAEKSRNMGAQLQSLRCTTVTKLSRKIYFLFDFWCAQTYSFWAIFWTTCTKFDTCCWCYV